MEMEVTIKQEKVEERDVKFEQNMLDSMEIKVDTIKVEPHLYVPEPNNLDQECNLTEEAKIVGSNDKQMFDSLFNNEILPKEKDSQIKLEVCEEIEKTDEMVDVKWKIENDELDIKDDINIEDREQGNASTLVPRQRHRKTSAACGSKKKMNGNNYFKCKLCKYKTKQLKHLKSHLERHTKSMIARHNRSYKCDQCDYQTINKYILKRHSLVHKNADEVDMHKCDQCDYKTLYKHCLKFHLLNHKNVEEANMYKCDQCDYQTIHTRYLKKHSSRHKKPGEVDMYKCNQIYKTKVYMYKCEQCDFETVNRGSLQKHLLKHINHDKMYECDRCLYKTFSKDNFNQHLLKRKDIDGNNIYKCI